MHKYKKVLGYIVMALLVELLLGFVSIKLSLYLIDRHVDWLASFVGQLWLFGLVGLPAMYFYNRYKKERK